MLQRHPLYSVAQVVYYIDSFFKNNLALKIGQVGKSVYDCYVFQCHSEVRTLGLRRQLVFGLCVIISSVNIGAKTQSPGSEFELHMIFSTFTPLLQEQSQNVCQSIKGVFDIVSNHAS